MLLAGFKVESDFKELKKKKWGGGGGFCNHSFLFIDKQNLQMSHDQLLSDASKPNIRNYLENFSAAELHGVLLSHSANKKKNLTQDLSSHFFVHS